MKYLKTFKSADDAVLWLRQLRNNEIDYRLDVVKVETSRTIKDVDGHALTESVSVKWAVMIDPPKYVDQGILIGGDNDGFDDNTEL